MLNFQLKSVSLPCCGSAQRMMGLLGSEGGDAAFTIRKVVEKVL